MTDQSFKYLDALLLYKPPDVVIGSKKSIELLLILRSGAAVFERCLHPRYVRLDLPLILRRDRFLGRELCLTANEQTIKV